MKIGISEFCFFFADDGICYRTVANKHLVLSRFFARCTANKNDKAAKKIRLYQDFRFIQIFVRCDCLLQSVLSYRYCQSFCYQEINSCHYFSLMGYYGTIARLTNFLRICVKLNMHVKLIELVIHHKRILKLSGVLLCRAYRLELKALKLTVFHTLVEIKLPAFGFSIFFCKNYYYLQTLSSA